MISNSFCRNDSQTKTLTNVKICELHCRGRIQTEVEGGATWRWGAETGWKLNAPKARENFWGVVGENSLVFLLNYALVDMFPRIQNETLKKECIWVRIRGAFLAKKGAPKLNFHREGGQLPPSAPQIRH